MRECIFFVFISVFIQKRHACQERSEWVRKYSTIPTLSKYSTYYTLRMVAQQKGGVCACVSVNKRIWRSDTTKMAIMNIAWNKKSESVRPLPAHHWLSLSHTTLANNEYCLNKSENRALFLFAFYIEINSAPGHQIKAPVNLPMPHAFMHLESHQ